MQAARAGEIIGLAGSYVHRDKVVTYSFAGIVGSYGLIGGLDCVKERLVRSPWQKIEGTVLPDFTPKQRLISPFGTGPLGLPEHVAELDRCHDEQQDGPGGEGLFDTGPFFFLIIGHHCCLPVVCAHSVRAAGGSSVGKVTK